jgi:hypothetical protein
MSQNEEMTVSLGAGATEEVAADIKGKAKVFVENYTAALKERTEAYKKLMAAPKIEEAPTLAGGYQYANCLTVGPVQFYGDPPYRPSNIIAAGEWTLMLGVAWINPANSPGGGWPGTVTLGGRGYRARFETINLSDVTNEPWWGQTGTFHNPANQIYVFPWWRLWPDPGINPNLYESYFTLDIVELGQPFAAFSSWHFDVDAEPGFLGVPATPAGWKEGPARFLVYRKD